MVLSHRIATNKCRLQNIFLSTIFHNNIFLKFKSQNKINYEFLHFTLILSMKVTIKK